MSILKVGDAEESKYDLIYNKTLQVFMRVFMKSVSVAHVSAPIAEEVTAYGLERFLGLLCKDHLAALHYQIHTDQAFSDEKPGIARVKKLGDKDCYHRWQQGEQFVEDGEGIQSRDIDT